MVKELNKFILSAIAIIGLTVIVLVGIAVTTNYSKVLRTDTLVNKNDTLLATLVVNQSIRIGATAGDFPFLQSLSGCINSTGAAGAENELSASDFTIEEGNKDGGFIAITGTKGGDFWNNTAINCTSVGYLAGTGGQIAADKFSTGLGVFGTFAVILILAIIGKAIIGLFKKID